MVALDTAPDKAISVYDFAESVYDFAAAIEERLPQRENSCKGFSKNVGADHENVVTARHRICL